MRVFAAAMTMLFSLTGKKMFYFHVTLQVLESLICVTVGKIFPCPPQEKHFPTDLTDLWQTDKASHLFRLTGIKLTPLSRAPSLPIG